MRNVTRIVLKLRWLAACCVATSAAATAADPPRYRIIDLTEIAEQHGVIQSEARAMNERGEIVGFEALPDYQAQAILWRPDCTVLLLPRLLEDDNSNYAVNVGHSGTVVGASEKVTIEQVGHQQRIFIDQKGTFWENESPVNLNDLVTGGPPIDLRFIWDMDSSGRFIGHGRSFGDPPYTLYGFLFEDGQLADLGLLDHPYAINNNLQIVGYNGTGQRHAYLWDNGVLVNLHDYSDIHGVTTTAYDINDNSLIVGEAQFEISRPEEPALWTSEGPQRLVPEYNRPQGVATAINNHDVIVGYYTNLDDVNDPFHGVIWEDGVRSDLLDLIQPDDGWQVLYPFDINDRGQIVGGGLRNGQWGRAFLITPVAQADLTGVQVIRGTLLDGNVYDMAGSDDQFVRTRSGFGQTLVDLHNMTMVIGANTTVQNASTIDLSVETRISHPTGTMQIRLKNWTTGQFDLLGTRAISDAEQVYTIDGIGATNYVESGTGNIELSLKHVVFVPQFAFLFDSWIDWVKIAVQ